MVRRILSLTIGVLLFSGLQAEAKKYIVTVKSPQTYLMLSAQAKGFHTFGAFAGKSNKFSFLNNGESKITDTFDNLDMLVLDTNSKQDLAAMKASGDVEIEEEMILPEPISPFGKKKRKKSEQPGVVKGPLEMPWGIKAVMAPEAWGGADYGQGVRVLILDTGIDKDHPGLMSRFEKGKNFMEREDSPAYEYLDINGHGTHVAGTIAADGLGGNLVGVAPKAKILSGRVCSDGCSTIAIVAGVDWGISEKVDVMNLSLGGPMPSMAAQKAYERAEAANIVIVAASGNDGAATISYPAAYKTPIAVGAVDAKLAKADFSNWGPELDVVAPGVDIFSSVPLGMGRDAKIEMTTKSGSLPITGLPMSGTEVSSAAGDLVYVNLAKPENLAGLDLTGKVALAQRGEISFKEKADNCLALGAVGVIVFNHEDGPLAGTLGDGVQMNVPILGIAKTDGESIVALLQSGETVNMNASIIKTDYSVFQGTSMASPHTAGVVALILGANPKLKPSAVRDLLKKTATPLAGPNDENQWGAGMINAEAAVNQAQTLGSGAESLLTGVF